MNESIDSSIRVDCFAFSNTEFRHIDGDRNYFDLAWVPNQQVKTQLEEHLKQPFSVEAEWDQRYFTHLYEQVLSSVARELNRYHRLDLDLKQWEIIIGYWLVILISSYIQTYDKVAKITSNHESIRLFTKSISREFNPQYLNLETNRISEDPEFYSYVLESISKHFPNIEVVYNETTEIYEPPLEEIQRTQIKLTKRLSLKFTILTKQVLSNLYKKYHKTLNPSGLYLIAQWIPARTWLSLSIRTRSIVLPIERAFNREFQPFSESRTRENWITYAHPDNQIEKLILQIVEKSIPRSLLEDFREHLGMIQEMRLDFYPQVLISNLDHCTGSDLKRIWFGMYGQKARTFSIMQHGGAYGCYKDQLSFFFEKRVSDIFFAWGWERIIEDGMTVKNIPSLRFLKNSFPKYQTSAPIYLMLCPEPEFPTIHFPSQPSASTGYLRYLFELNNLLNGMQISESSRVHVKTQSRRTKITSAFFQNYQPEIKVDKTSKMNEINSRFLISTYNGTNSIECLLSGIPTIFYWMPEYCNFSEEADKVFTLLRASGILHSQKETALQILNLSPNDRKLWWDSPEVQSARERFLATFGDTKGGSRRFCEIIADLSVR